ncbi:hypothetical protein [Cyclobacterium xiamenense]|uniref:hypothetical protein n=1 Tax=Cyclobacterium xiamenense TaxID=1297121 RepID=UPI0035D127E5
MLEFFKINDPLRMAGILFLLLFFRVPYLFIDIPFTQPELLWQMLGERTAAGNLPYVDTLDGTGPFSMLIYWLNELLTGNSLLSFRIFAFLLLVVQIYFTNELFIKINAYEETNYFPALIMAITFQLSFDFMTLSPALMGSLFLMLAMGHLLSQTSINANPVPAVLLMGFWGGVAFCFHFPYLAFLPFLILAGLLIIGISFQQLCLLLTAYLLPVSCCMVYYFLQDGLDEFVKLYLLLGFRVSPVYHVLPKDLLIIFSLPLLLAIIGYVNNNLQHRMNVTQQKQNQLMMVFLLVNMGSFFLLDRVSPFQFVMLVPPLVYFIAHLFGLSRKKSTQQSLIYSYLFLVPLIGYGGTVYQTHASTVDRYAVRPISTDKNSPEKKIMVLGEDMHRYSGTGLGNPYLNFRLTRQYFKEMDPMDRKMKFYRDLRKTSPDVIIDAERTYDAWASGIPSLEQRYHRNGQQLTKKE